MKRTRILRICGCLPAVVTFLGLTAAPKLQAEFECKQELMAGGWIAYGNLFGQGIFPPGPWSAVSLTVFDEQGFATTAIQTNTTSLTPNDVEAEDFLESFDVQFTINPDCTGKYTFTVPAGPLIFELDVVCGNGQRECYATFTETPPPGNTDPVGIIGVWTLKKVDAFDQQLEAKVDALAAELSFVKDLAKRLAATHGVLRREDVDR